MKEKIRIVWNMAIALLVFGAWLRMALAGGGLLSGPGISNLKYFTVLSNLLEGIACVLWLVLRKGTHRSALERLKYTAGIAVFITFTVVAGFLGPLYGFGNMYSGANLFFHLIVPVLAVAELFFLADAPAGKPGRGSRARRP